MGDYFIIPDASQQKEKTTSLCIAAPRLHHHLQKHLHHHNMKERHPLLSIHKNILNRRLVGKPMQYKIALNNYNRRIICRIRFANR